MPLALVEAETSFNKNPRLTKPWVFYLTRARLPAKTTKDHDKNNRNYR
jgi:hypothetical protein